MTRDEIHLTALLRQMDQLIFRMSQCHNWNEMRPLYQELLQGTMFRMNAESDRIRMLMVPEIVRTYAKEENPSTKGHPRLEGPRDASDVASVRPMGQDGGDDPTSARGPNDDD